MPGCFQRRCLTASLLVTGLVAGGIQAGEAAPLQPGVPAGVHQAQLDRSTVALVGGGILLVGGFAVLIASVQHENISETVFTNGGAGSGPVTGNSTTSTTTSTH